jgi:oxalate---CoA ligase
MTPTNDTAAAGPVLAIIERHAETRGDVPAILAPGDPTGLSYRRLSTRLHAIRAALTGLGVRPGHRVAVVTGNDADSAALLLGVLAAAACCPVNPLWSAAETQDYLDTLDVALILLADGAGTAAPQQVATAKAAAVAIRFTGEDDVVVQTLRSGRPAEMAATGPYPDEALLLRTSGTTSTGKVVSHDAAAVVAAAQATVDAYHLTEADRRFNVMPFFHVQGLVGALVASLIPGGSIVCVPSPDPTTVLRHAVDSEATWLSATSTMHHLMVRNIPRDRWPGALRFVRCGSGALTDSLRAELEAGYGLPVVESYGMSEAHQIASTPLPGDPAAAGIVPSGSEVAVINQRDQVKTEAGATGEIVIRGANVMHGYVWPPGLESPFVAGWLRTGDLGCLLPDGSFQITGRVKEMINVGGEKVSPFEVEEAMLSHPAVSEAAAFGIPDPVRDEQLGAVLVLRKGMTVSDDALRAYLGQRLAPVKVPRRFLRRADVPVAESGKIRRGSLAEVLAEELAAAEADVTTATGTAAKAIPTRPRQGRLPRPFSRGCGRSCSNARTLACRTTSWRCPGTHCRRWPC